MFDEINAIDDPRADNARHFLTDILVIAMLAVMAEADAPSPSRAHLL